VITSSGIAPAPRPGISLGAVTGVTAVTGDKMVSQTPICAHVAFKNITSDCSDSGDKRCGSVISSATGCIAVTGMKAVPLIVCVGVDIVQVALR
jgi:hypothetical protein